MTRQSDYVVATIGSEIRRACTEYVGDPSISKAFDAMDHTRVKWVEVRWWLNDEIRVLNRYEVTHHVSNRPPLGDPVEYEPNGELPPEPGYELQVAIYPPRVSPDDRKQLAVAAETQREAWQVIDQALGVILLEAAR